MTQAAPHRGELVLTAEIIEGMDASVTMSLYPGMGHAINQDEIDFGRALPIAFAGQ